jgi:hypothetical protein
VEEDVSPEPSIEELQAEADHAARRLALLRRRIYIGRADPRRLPEYERIAQGAADRLRRAQARAKGDTGTR